MSHIHLDKQKTCSHDTPNLNTPIRRIVTPYGNFTKQKDISSFFIGHIQIHVKVVHVCLSPRKPLNMCPAETNRPEREAIGEPRKRSPSNHPTIIVGKAMLDSGNVGILTL